MTKHILAFGNPVYDLISTPMFKKQDRVLSGCSTNACLAAVKMEEHARLVGTIGSDFSNRLENDLQQWGIDFHLFPSQQTGGFNIVYDNLGNRKLSILGIADQIPESVDGFRDVDFILIGPIFGEVTIDLALQIAKKANAPILLDPQGLLRKVRNGVVTHTMTEQFKSIARISTIIKANELETRVITGVNPRIHPDLAARSLYRFGCKIAIVTLAEAGSVIYDGEYIYHIPPYTTNAVDPTGAGDTYAAGFMVKYLETDDLTTVGCFASAVASVMVENTGPEFPLTREEANRRADVLLTRTQLIKP
jgi:sugar/nucleoside kinase (ribokinase family)